VWTDCSQNWTNLCLPGNGNYPTKRLVVHKISMYRTKHSVLTWITYSFANRPFGGSIEIHQQVLSLQWAKALRHKSLNCTSCEGQKDRYPPKPAIADLQWNRAAALYVRAEFINAKQSNKESVIAWSLRPRRYQNTLVNTERSISDDDLKLHFVLGLKTSLKDIRSSILHDVDKFTWFTLVNEIESRSKAKGGMKPLFDTNSSNPPANVATTVQPTSFKVNKSWRRPKAALANVKCMFCLMNNHAEKDCRIKKGIEYRRQQGTGTELATMAGTNRAAAGHTAKSVTSDSGR